MLPALPPPIFASRHASKALRPEAGVAHRLTMKKRSRILTITYNDQGISWGPAVHFLELWNSVSRGHSEEVEVIGIAPSWTGQAPIIPPLFTLKAIWVPNIPLLRQLVFDAIASAYIVKHRKDVIYLRSSQSFFSLFFIALFRVPLVLELNGIAKADISNQRMKKTKTDVLFSGIKALCGRHRQEVFLIKRAKLCIAVTKSIKQYADDAGAQKCIHVENGVSHRFFEIESDGASRSRPTVIYVGTFTPWDGAQHIPGLARQFPKVDFLVVGDGHLRSEIESDAPANVEFTGYQDYAGLVNCYSQADAGLVLYEASMRNNTVGSSSMKIKEYLASGLPIFTTRLPGHEFIEESGIGRTIDIENLEQDFRSFLADLQTHQNHVAAFRVRERSNISWDGAARKTVAAIDEFSE